MVWLGLLEMEKSLRHSVSRLSIETFHASYRHKHNLMVYNLSLDEHKPLAQTQLDGTQLDRTQLDGTQLEAWFKQLEPR
jgi:hypothetical protein